MSSPDELRAQAAALEAKAIELETQLTRADLAGMTSQAIEQARVDGRFNNLMAGITPTTEEH